MPDYAKLATDFEKMAIPVGVPDPVWGMVSSTWERKGVSLNQVILDGMTDITAGRRPLSDFDTLTREWAANGGDQIRTEFEQAIAAAG